MYKVWTKFGQNGIKDVASRVFTKMLQKDWQNEGQTDSSITIIDEFYYQKYLTNDIITQ